MLINHNYTIRRKCTTLYYELNERTFERLNDLYEKFIEISQGKLADMTEVRVLVASMSGPFQRILEEDIRCISEYDDGNWDDNESPSFFSDEDTPIETWSIVPPNNLGSLSDIIEYVDTSWFQKRDGIKDYKPSMDAIKIAKTLIAGTECPASVCARYFQDIAYDYDYLYMDENITARRCTCCHNRKSCICETAWNMNGPTITLHPVGWLNKNRKWQRHGLRTIGEIQLKRHPVLVCLCPWEECPVRTAVGFAEWKTKFIG